ncbi:hypothetical protein BC834DRAFT_821015, partial [Gloeopeniophorella convolvens]
DEALERLGALLPPQLLFAALDLIDRECGKPLAARPVPAVVKYVAPWGRAHFSVLGQTSAYTVFPRLRLAVAARAFCTCPAFAYAVLIAQSQLVCKHVLAAQIAERLAKCVVRELGKDEFAAVLARQLGSGALGTQ